MNGKKAKALRKLAQRATVGRPQSAYVRHKKKGNVVLSGSTTKGLYRGVKKAYVKDELSSDRIRELVQKV